MDSSEVRGVLSQTLASSPMINSVLSARIRSPLLNDVVFVGPNSIHLREFTHQGYLSNVLADLELDAQILSAKAVSAEEHVLSIEDAILENGRDEIRYTIRGEPCPEDQPAQIVVLSLASGDLVFVYAKTFIDGDIHFLHARRRILPTRNLLNKYGKLLAVDTESRALAVASTRGTFGIFSLKSVDQIKKNIDEWDPRAPEHMQPFTEQRFVPIDGTILHMDFLRSPTADPNRVVLLLIVTYAGATRLLLYTWNSTTSLSTLKPLRCSGQPLPVEDASPQLLIPSCRWTSFAIVTGPKIVFYDDVNSRTMKRSQVKLGDSTDTEKRWVQFAKPFRHPEHMKKKEDIFLVREDGHIGSVVVTHNSQSRFSINLSPGQLGITVSTALCALSAPPTRGGDILIACGHTTDGGVFHLAALKAPSQLQKLPNWAPINQIVKLSHARSGSRFGSSTILASTGTHKDNSFLSALRHGTEVQVVTSLEHDEAGSMDQIWSLRRTYNNDLLFLSSHHDYTSAFSYSLLSGEPRMEDSESLQGFVMNRPTLAASVINAAQVKEDIVLQINNDAIALVSSLGTNVSLSCAWTGHFLVADILPPVGDSARFAIVDNNGTTVRLTSGLVAATGARSWEVLQGQGVELSYIPVDLKLFTCQDVTFCVTLSQDDDIILHERNSDAAFFHHSQWNLSDLDTGIADVHFASLVILRTGDRGLLACGTKTGMLLLLELSQRSDKNFKLKVAKKYSIGDTSVQVVADSNVDGREQLAFATCNSSVVQIRLHHTRHGLDFTVSSLIMTDQHDVSFATTEVRAINRIGTSPHAIGSHDLSGMIICAVQHELLLLSPGATTTSVRPIQAIPPSSLLAYDKHLQCCIVGGNGPDQSVVRQASNVPYLQVLDVNDVWRKQQLIKIPITVGEPGEMVRMICPWQPTTEFTKGGIHFNLILYNTEVEGVSKLSYIASEVFLGCPNEAHSIIEYPGQRIHAVCVFRQSSLVLCVDKTLRMITLDLEKQDWTFHDADFELPSPAMEMEAQGHVLYVATASHSFMLVREEDGHFRQVGSDKWAGTARNIIPYGRHSTLVNLISDQGSRILSFPERPKQGMHPTFEARLPQSVDRISWLKSSHGGRDRLLGTTANGTIYLFTLLSEPEMQLLNYLQSLTEPTKDQRAKALGALAQKIAANFASKLEAKDVVPPEMGSTHARGEVLVKMLSPGAYNLWYLLQKREALDGDSIIKQEDEIELLDAKARPVIGGAGDDVVDRLMLWLRRLLDVDL